MECYLFDCCAEFDTFEVIEGFLICRDCLVVLFRMLNWGFAFFIIVSFVGMIL